MFFLLNFNKCSSTRSSQISAQPSKASSTLNWKTVIWQLLLVAISHSFPPNNFPPLPFRTTWRSAWKTEWSVRWSADSTSRRWSWKATNSSASTARRSAVTAMNWCQLVKWWWVIRDYWRQILNILIIYDYWRQILKNQLTGSYLWYPIPSLTLPHPYP